MTRKGPSHILMGVVICSWIIRTKTIYGKTCVCSFLSFLALSSYLLLCSLLFWSYELLINRLMFQDIDPETLLEWLAISEGSDRDIQLLALEQLCMILLMSDNVDKCFERWEARTVILFFFLNE